MCCGTAQNSYRTVESMKVVLSDGTLLDTVTVLASTIRASPQTLFDGIAELHRQTSSNQELADRIRHKYRLKNTTGYALTH
ncbi:hypothetical protein OK016_28835 [Vibrio chagasii]|nr:hypothetical protein [Vibrio chagasii]